MTRMAGKKNLDDRQIRFLVNYLDPKSKTYSDAKNSALAVGFTKKYADNITALMPDWLGEAIGRRKRLLVKAEKNLEQVLDLDIYQDAIGPFGPIINKKTKKPYKVLSSKVLISRGNASEFIAKTVGKEHYSEKGNGGNQTNIIVVLPESLARKRGINSDTESSSGGSTPLPSIENRKTGREDDISR